MAIREIIKDTDEQLRKISRLVEDIDYKVLLLLDDMKETMAKNNGVGLAAPQLSMLKRIITVDSGTEILEIINPVIISKKGSQIAVEGCLSIPGLYGEVRRPKYVQVEGLNRFGEKIKIDGEDLLATVLSHEIDHLDGILFTDKVLRYIDPETRPKRG